ncbi:MAG: prepilin-type N-terminal cleavage/methylation domain-containing protein [Planctomycetes bacterium]|nr:prepilin-type N-terminal cleavage/methylation domain-containing protein [Planctomycetota bacterium]
MILNSQNKRGMTLVELMLAVLLASFVMFAIVRFVEVSLGLWSRAEDTRRHDGRGRAVLQRLRQDLITAHPGQVGDFLVEWQGFDLDGDRANDRTYPRLRMVRRPSALDWRRLTLQEMTVEQRESFAELGFGTGSAAAVGLKNGDWSPEDVAAGIATAPGLVEAAWVLLPDGEGETGAGTLYRAERKRKHNGDRLSFFHDSFVEANGSVEDESLQRVTGGVLWWALEMGTDQSAEDWTVGVAPGQVRLAWDALGQGRPDKESAAQNETAVDIPLVQGRPLLPRKARIVIELETDRGVASAPFLVESLDREVTSFEVSRGESLPAKPGSYVRIGSEWMRFVSRDRDRMVVERGQRGTLPSLHAVDSKIRFGHRTEAIVAIPTSRQEWR